MNMYPTEHHPLHYEWVTLQKNHEQYEHYALLIKLTAFVLTLAALALSIGLISSVSLIAALWLQEGIWKTFQARIADRLMDIEYQLRDLSSAAEFQLYSQWQQKRPNTVGLISQYVANSLRPTVAFPYAVLILLCMLNALLF